MTLATIVLAASTVGARHISKLHEHAPLAKSFEADPDDWSDEAWDGHGAAMPLDEGVAGRSPRLRCESVLNVGDAEP